MGSAHGRYWFPAKRLGWGWGAPRVWQGWAVLAVFFVLVVSGAVVLLPGRSPLAFLAWSILLCALLVVVCWVKGEPPRWRGGGE